jgi:STE24 endopeptidase
MNSFTTLFLSVLVISFGIEWWLARRQVAYVRICRSEVPDPFRATISLEAHQKAADYTVDKARLGEFELILQAAILLFFTLGGGIEGIHQFWNNFGFSPLMTGVSVILTTLLLVQLLELPFNIYQTFVLEERYGFNRNTPRQFMIDLVLQTLLSMVIGAPLLAMILWVMDSLGSYWWLIAWAILVGFSILMSWAFPTLIAPLFNKFSPLTDETLRTRIESLLERCGFHSRGIFVMDGSRRSSHGNAYFTGIGDSKRIVFFDTLINTLDHDELEAVLAHELGHFRRKHVLKMLITSSTITLIGFALLGWLSGQNWFYSGLGVGTPSHATALLLFIMVAPIFSSFLRPALAYFQRRHEFEADDFAAAYAKPSCLISALVKLYRDNASTLTPDPLYSAFHYSHPPAAIRIANLATKTS